MSRPRKNHPRQHQVNVRFNTSELVRVHDHAFIAGKTVTEFGRALMLRRPRRRTARPVAIISLSPRALERWRIHGNAINHLAHDLNAHHQLDPRALAVSLTRLRLLLRQSFPPDFDAATAYVLAPATRCQLRKLCTNLVQIADRFRVLGLTPPLPLSNLIGRLRAILNGDRAAHGA